jgi:flavin-binding protein dodecin
MLLDYPKDKSFSYPIYNYITRENNQIRNVRFKPIPKNKVRPTIIIPLINVYHLQTDSGKVALGSGLGFSAGLDYFIKEKTYISFTAGITLDCFSPRHDTINATAIAVKTAGKTVKGIRSVYIHHLTALVKDNKISEFRVNAKITFEVLN